MEVGQYIDASRRRKIGTNLQAERTFHEVTHSPSTVKPGETMRVTVKTDKGLLLIPGTLALTFDLDIVSDPTEPGSSVNAYPVNNLAANIISKIFIKANSKDICILDYAHLYNTYRDLWLTEEKRTNSVFEGIQDEELRKIRCDLKITLTVVKSINTELKHVFGKRYRLPLNFELIGDHMPLSANDLEDEISFELTVNENKYVLKYSNDSLVIIYLCLQTTLKMKFRLN